MGFVLAGAAIAAAGTAYAANKASKAADKQKDAMDDQAAIAKEQLDFGKSQYADWKNMFYPAMGDLRTMAYQEQRPDYAAISADVDKSFDTAQDVNRRTMERYGVKPTDGAFNASETQYGLGRAMATVGANNQARKQAKDSQYNRLASFVGMGNGQQQIASSTMNQGFGNSMNAYGNQANMYGNSANQYSQAAAAGAQMLGRLGSSWMNGGSGTSFTPSVSLDQNTQNGGIDLTNRYTG